jgi:ribosome-binding factor A
MPKEFKRTQRIEEVMQREIALLLQTQIRDPRFTTKVTVSAVSVAPNLENAKIYVTFLEEDQEKILANLKILNHAAKHLRFLLAKIIKMRIIPQLRFVYDESVTYGSRLTQLIDKLEPTPKDDGEQG